METLPPTGWADVLRKPDLDAFEERMSGRFGAFESRFDDLEAHLDVSFKRFQRRIIQWNVATLIVATGAAAAIARLT